MSTDDDILEKTETERQLNSESDRGILGNTVEKLDLENVSDRGQIESKDKGKQRVSYLLKLGECLAEQGLVKI